MKTKNLKATAVQVPRTLDQAERMIGEIGELQRQVAGVENDMNELLASVKRKHEEIARPMNEKIEKLFQAVHMYAEAHRASLLDGDSKTVKLATGEIRWRNTPPSVRLKRNRQEALIEALKAAKLGRFVRSYDEIDKEAILKEPDAIADLDGIEIAQHEEFVVKPFASQIERVAKVKAKKPKAKKAA